MRNLLRIEELYAFQRDEEPPPIWSRLLALGVSTAAAAHAWMVRGQVWPSILPLVLAVVFFTPYLANRFFPVFSYLIQAIMQTARIVCMLIFYYTFYFLTALYYRAFKSEKSSFVLGRTSTIETSQRNEIDFERMF